MPFSIDKLPISSGNLSSERMAGLFSGDGNEKGFGDVKMKICSELY